MLGKNLVGLRLFVHGACHQINPPRPSISSLPQSQPHLPTHNPSSVLPTPATCTGRFHQTDTLLCSFCTGCKQIPSLPIESYSSALSFFCRSISSAVYASSLEDSSPSLGFLPEHLSFILFTPCHITSSNMASQIILGPSIGPVDSTTTITANIATRLISPPWEHHRAACHLRIISSLVPSPQNQN